MSNAAHTGGAPGVRIAGTGMAIPSRRVTNDDLREHADTTDEWIVQRTGIRQRNICTDHEQAADLAREAVLQAIKNASVRPEELDLLITATATPDMIMPTLACQVVAEIGAVPCGAMEMNLACTGFVAAINTAWAFIRTGMYRTIAVVGAEKLSRVTDWKDRRTCILFGDGAGAAILTASDDPSQGCIYQNIHSDGTKARDLYVPRTEAHILNPDIFNGNLGTIQMNGREVFKFAVSTLERYIREAMEKCGLSPSDIAMVIPHQSNARIIESARERLGFSEDQVYVNIDRYGNTSAASVGICLHELMEAGRLKKGDTIIFMGVGAGVTWATSVWKL